MPKNIVQKKLDKLIYCCDGMSSEYRECNHGNAKEWLRHIDIAYSNYEEAVDEALEAEEEALKHSSNTEIPSQVKIDKIEVPKQVQIDEWKAEYAMLLIQQTHCTLEQAIDNAHAQFDNIDGDIETTTPQDAVEEEIDSMRSLC